MSFYPYDPSRRLSEIPQRKYIDEYKKNERVCDGPGDLYKERNNTAVVSSAPSHLFEEIALSKDKGWFDNAFKDERNFYFPIANGIPLKRIYDFAKPEIVDKDGDLCLMVGKKIGANLDGEKLQRKGYNVNAKVELPSGGVYGNVCVGRNGIHYNTGAEYNLLGGGGGLGIKIPGTNYTVDVNGSFVAGGGGAMEAGVGNFMKDDECRSGIYMGGSVASAAGVSGKLSLSRPCESPEIRPKDLVREINVVPTIANHLKNIHSGAFRKK